MKRKVWEFMQQHHMITENDRVVVGVSGGADSMALLDVLLNFREHKSFEVGVVHINHNIRGAEALRDQRFVEEYCTAHEIPYRIFSYDVPRIAKEEHMTLEEAGRKARHEAFDSFLREWKGDKIALAHHQNDLAETMLFHLARGTGLAGLSGIAPVNGNVIRPFLCIERTEIEQYLEKKKLKFVNDSSNEEMDYTRNKIRHELIDFMVKEINPKTISHMANTAILIRQSEEYMMMAAKKACDRHSYMKENHSVMLMCSLLEEAPIIQTYVIRQLLMECCSSIKDISSQNISSIQELFINQTSKKIALPYDMEAVRTYEGVVLRRRKDSVTEQIREVPLTVPGWTKWENEGFLTNLYPYGGQEIHSKMYTKCLNYDKIRPGLTIRQRRSGDYIIVNKEGGRKKLKDYMIDCKIPRELRDSIPVLATGSEILWVIGYRISEYYKITEDTKKLLEITYQGGTKNE